MDQKKDFDILFLGGLFPQEMLSEILRNSIGGVDNAANNLQWNLVSGLDKHLIKPISVVNSLYVGSYPRRYKKGLISTSDFAHSVGSKDVNVGFLNIPLVKHLSRALSVRPHLKKWVFNKSNRPKVVIAYALTSVFVDALCYIKKLCPQVVTVIVVPDLPQYMNTTTDVNLMYDLLVSLSVRHILKNVKKIDSFVLLTDHMADALCIRGKKYVVVEGIADAAHNDAIECRPTTSEINIVYTGTLNRKYGVVNLVEAFTRTINPKYRLVICGSGDSADVIANAAKKDSRILFRGQLPRPEIIKIQNSAYVLVNPRQNNEIFTKYSFPSKNLEYLSSGRPVIAYKLDGIPNEYDPFFHYVSDNTVDALSQKIVEVCSKPTIEINLVGEVARKWVLENKNTFVQTKKIIDMISSSTV